jgi:light-regulated signal transduction histidine kinase (bacteriophytochrome)
MNNNVEKITFRKPLSLTFHFPTTKAEIQLTPEQAMELYEELKQLSRSQPWKAARKKAGLDQ